MAPRATPWLKQSCLENIRTGLSKQITRDLSIQGNLVENKFRFNIYRTMMELQTEIKSSEVIKKLFLFFILHISIMNTD